MAGFHRFPLGTLEQQHADCEMENDKFKSDAQRFRDYAAECRRLAQRASEKDRQVLNEIADAWISAAEEADRKSRSVK